MMCEGVMLYLMLVVVFTRIIEKWWLFLLLGWGEIMLYRIICYSVLLTLLQFDFLPGIPVIFVVIGVGAVLDEYGVRDSEGKLL